MPITICLQFGITNPIQNTSMELSMSLYFLITAYFGPHPASCNGWNQMKGGEFTDGTYIIDPDSKGGNEPFEVQCLLEGSIAWTSVGHERETQTVAGGGSPYTQKAFSNRFPITYKITDSKLKALLNVSVQCKMKIVVNCIAMKIDYHAGWKGVSGTQHLLADVLCPGRTIYVV